ncbi:MAG: T9SS type A sorting domain-containing protein, partial [FCB group bacterium]
MTSKLVNGIYIEFLGGFINGAGGIWAQELNDRGFDFMCGNRDTLCQWKRWSTNPNPENKHWILEDSCYNENGRYSIRITGDSNNNLYGLYQNILINDEVPHQFYIYSQSPYTETFFKIIIYDTLFQKKLYESDNIHSQNYWKKKELTIPQIKGNYSCNILIAVCGKGYIDFDEASLMPADNILGMRSEYYKFFKNLNPGIIRYPGGCFADTKQADWKEAVNPIDKRVSPNMVYNIVNQRKDIGTDELMKICKILHMEPYFVVNYETGTSEYAANWVEYCNGDTNTVFGRLRALNGYPEPYNVKYWEVGNEQWKDPQSYALGYLDYYSKMKAVDSSIKIIIDGNCWDTTSFKILMGKVKEKCQIFGYHPAKGIPYYIPGTDRDKYLAMVAEDGTENLMRCYSNQINDFKLNNLKIAATEWWSTYGTSKDWLLDTNIRNASMEAALWNAYEMLCYFRNPQIFEFATRTVGLGLIRSGINNTGKKVIYATPSFYALSMISNHCGDTIYNTSFKSGSYSNTKDTNLWVDYSPWFDVTASGKSDTLFLAVINRHPENQIHANIHLDCLSKVTMSKAYILKSENYLDANTVDRPVYITASDTNFIFTGEYYFSPHSLTILAIPVMFGSPSYVRDSSNLSQNCSINILPNPVGDNLNIISSNYFIKGNTIEIYDIIGREIYTTDISENTKFIDIPIQQVSPGVYFLKIRNNNN